MAERFFKVTLIADVVINSKLATEGNMETLDYIPGSNFLGIAASQLYDQIDAEKAYDYFHSGKVSFGDAVISKNNEISYAVPFDYMMVKGEDKLGESPVYLQHLLEENNHPKDSNGYKLQLKQKRAGYLTPSGLVAPKIEKRFAIKSAQDSQNRRSKDGAMYGFESLKKGQEFIFSVQAENEEQLNEIEDALKGDKYIGKSKSAQYGHVKVEPISQIPDKIKTFNSEEDYTLVYAESNLCFFDEFGQITLQPKAKDLGVEGEVDYSKSQIRTYSYSPWNGKRNTTDSARICIATGSVFYVKGKNKSGFHRVSAYQAEGLGRVIVNPDFLKGNKADAICSFVKIIDKKEEQKPNVELNIELVQVQSPLGKFLKARAIQQGDELELSRSIQRAYLNATSKEGTGCYKKVTSSQWGAIRAYATKATSFIDLRRDLLEGEDAYLKHGVAYDRIWNQGQNLKNLKAVFETAEKSSNPTVFIAKFAAQMAKYEQKKPNKKDE